MLVFDIIRLIPLRIGGVHMGVTVDWDTIDNVIIRSTFETQWTWADFDAATDSIIQLANSVQHPVDLLTDLTGTQYFPQGSAGAYVMRLRKMRPKNLRFIVVVATTPEALSYMNMANRIDTTHRSSNSVRSIEEAYELLTRLREQQEKTKT